MRMCSKCGAMLGMGQNYCSNCGTQCGIGWDKLEEPRLALMREMALIITRYRNYVASIPIGCVGDHIIKESDIIIDRYEEMESPKNTVDTTGENDILDDGMEKGGE
jgi:hypothetical protein